MWMIYFIHTKDDFDSLPKRATRKKNMTVSDNLTARVWGKVCIHRKLAGFINSSSYIPISFGVVESARLSLFLTLKPSIG